MEGKSDQSLEAGFQKMAVPKIVPSARPPAKKAPPEYEATAAAERGPGRAPLFAQVFVAGL
jgi:hypothetical protein